MLPMINCSFGEVAEPMVFKGNGSYKCSGMLFIMNIIEKLRKKKIQFKLQTTSLNMLNIDNFLIFE